MTHHTLIILNTDGVEIAKVETEEQWIKFAAKFAREFDRESGEFDCWDDPDARDEDNTNFRYYRIDCASVGLDAAIKGAIENE